MPVHGYESGACGRHGVLVVAAVLVRHRPIRRDLDELELDRLPCRHGHVQEPVGIVGIEQRSNGGVERRAPVAEFHSAAREEDVVAGVGGDRIVHREGDRYQLGREYRELDRVGDRSSSVLYDHGPHAVRHAGNRERHRRFRPRGHRGGRAVDRDAAAGCAEAIPGHGHRHAGLRDRWADAADLGHGGRARNLPHAHRVRREAHASGWIVAAAARSHTQALSAQQAAQVVAVRSRRQRRIHPGHRLGRGVVLVDRHQDHVVVELAFVHVDIGVDPALLPAAVRQPVVILPQRRKLADEP